MEPIDLLVKALDEAFDRKSWHGTNLRGSIRGLTARVAAWRPGLRRHNVWEIAVHAAYWKYAVRRRLTGETRGSFPLAGSNWFRRSLDAGEEGWRDDVTLLVTEHRKLRAAVAALASSDLPKAAPGSRTTNETLVRGVAAHDLYHAGQIQLLKKLRPMR